MLMIGAKRALLSPRKTPIQQPPVPVHGLWGAPLNGSAVLSNGDRTVTISGSDIAVRSLSFCSTGVRQFELYVYPGGSIFTIGVGDASTSLGLGYFYRRYWLAMSDGTTRSPYTSWGGMSPFTFPSVIGVVVDFDTGAISFYQNGVIKGTPFYTLAGESVAPIVAQAANSVISYDLRTRDFVYPIAGATEWT